MTRMPMTTIPHGGTMDIKKISHLGVAVESIEDQIHFFKDVLELETAGVEIVEDQKVKVAFLKVGEMRIELLEPIAAQQVDFESVRVEQVNAASGTAEKEILAVIEIQRHQVVLPLVLVVRRNVEILAQAQAATERRGALRGVEERNFRDLILGAGRAREQRCREYERRDKAGSNARWLHLEISIGVCGNSTRCLPWRRPYIP